MFMSFDKDILALYTRGNDTGGRCIASAVAAVLDTDTVTLDLAWQSGTCGAPASAHYPFILVSLSRTAADGSSWVTPTRSVCGLVAGAADTRACATLSGASPTPTASASPSPSTTVTPTPSAVIPSPTPTRTVTASATASRSPVAAASPSPAPADQNANYLLYGMVVAIGLLVVAAVLLSRGSRNTPRR
jgi:cell division septation protein DedD